MAKTKLIVALNMSRDPAFDLLYRLRELRCLVKIGPQLFTSSGPFIVNESTGLGFGVFLDLKLHNTPHTVEMTAVEMARLHVDLFTVHACGGPKMLEAAVRGAIAGSLGRKPPMAIGVTVLTSQKADPMRVLDLAREAKRCGLGGAVCSGFETATLKAALGPEFIIINPAIRPLWSPDAHEQIRVTTPTEAAKAGADYVVVGRPIIEAVDPIEAAKKIMAELEAA